MFLFFSLVSNNKTPSDAKYNFRGQPQHLKLLVVDHPLTLEVSKLRQIGPMPQFT